jgi:outer membrane protein OmpA-like peptidoglycan-associated protein
VANKISKAIRGALGGVSVMMLAMAFSGGSAQAQSAGVGNTVTGERYAPGIWVDPDGCEHWVMDDGFEGYMTPHVNRQGIPVCRRGNVCGVMNSDQLFATNRYAISSAGRARLQQFFNEANARAYIIAGHTDSRASDAYNMRLSLNRANSVARVGQGVGAKIVDVRGYGERMPKASNKSSAGMRANRRVEIICIR